MCHHIWSPLGLLMALQLELKRYRTYAIFQVYLSLYKLYSVSVYYVAVFKMTEFPRNIAELSW